MKKNVWGDLGENCVEERGSWHGFDRYLKVKTSYYVYVTMSMDGGEDKKDDCPCQQPTNDGPSQTMWNVIDPIF